MIPTFTTSFILVALLSFTYGFAYYYIYRKPYWKQFLDLDILRDIYTQTRLRLTIHWGYVILNAVKRQRIRLGRR